MRSLITPWLVSATPQRASTVNRLGRPERSRDKTLRGSAQPQERRSGGAKRAQRPGGSGAAGRRLDCNRIWGMGV
jgi:hypothetical protein